MSGLNETNNYLIARVRECDDASAWGHFIHLYEPLVMKLCRKHGLQQADALDVTQDVFVALAQAMPRFSYDKARGSFRSWLIKVTRSKLVNFFHSRGKDKKIMDCPCLAEQAHYQDRPEIERDESIDQQWGLFGRVKSEIRREFRPNTWNAFWLTVMQGFTSEEVANHLGISVQAVYIAKSRVLKRIRMRVRELAA